MNDSSGWKFFAKLFGGAAVITFAAASVAYAWDRHDDQRRQARR